MGIDGFWAMVLSIQPKSSTMPPSLDLNVLAHYKAQQIFRLCQATNVTRDCNGFFINEAGCFLVHANNNGRRRRRRRGAGHGGKKNVVHIMPLRNKNDTRRRADMRRRRADGRARADARFDRIGIVVCSHQPRRGILAAFLAEKLIFPRFLSLGITLGVSQLASLQVSLMHSTAKQVSQGIASVVLVGLHLLAKARKKHVSVVLG